MEKLPNHTPDLTEKNIEKLAELFPNVITETRDEEGEVKQAVDFDLLRQELSDHLVEGPQERYQLDWPGKRQALLTANAPIAKTLRPVREESVDFDNTKNLFIEGDNLDALKLLQESYLGKVKLIYIDPPYNTGNDFVYEDDFAESNAEYQAKSGQVDEAGNRLKVNPESNGRFHSDWLSMMYPRLRQARNLLSQDGLILIHIDEHEVSNLAQVLREVFGEANDLGTIIWDKRNPKGDAHGISSQHEYIHLFARDRSTLLASAPLKRKKANAARILRKADSLYAKLNDDYSLADINRDFVKWIRSQDGLSGGERAYSRIDEAGEVYQAVSMAWPGTKPAPPEYFTPIKHPVTGKNCPVPDRGWRNPPETMRQMIANDEIVFGEDESTQPRSKYLLRSNMLENIPSLLSFGGDDTRLLKEIGIPFDTPKPLMVVTGLVEALTTGNDIVLDYFAGSATTAHAVLEANGRDGGSRRFIMIQIDEQMTPRSIGADSEFSTVADLGRERLRRSRDRLAQEFETVGDSGFRALQVTEASLRGACSHPEELFQKDLEPGNDTHDLRDVGSEELLFKCLVDWGLELSLPISSEITADREVLTVDDGVIIACFDEGIDRDLVRGIAEREPLRAVFRDSGFKSDADRINAEQIFKEVSPATEVKVI